MDSNGASAAVQLASRLAACEEAVAVLARRWEDQLVPRLMQTEAQLDNQADQLADMTAVLAASVELVHATRRELLELRRAHQPS